MKELFQVIDDHDFVLSAHESKKEAKRERDRHNALGQNTRVKKGREHWTAHIKPWK